MILDAADLQRVHSAEARKFEWVREQGFDTSCGYASVASLLEIYWGRPTAEQDLLPSSPPSDDGSFSLSMAEARRLIEQSGLDARGYRLTWDNLVPVVGQYAPVLIHYDRPRKHFALLLGIAGERVVVADPARGLEVLTRLEFEQRWSGAALFVGTARQSRNQAALDQAVAGALGRAEALEWNSVRVRSFLP